MHPKPGNKVEFRLKHKKKQIERHVACLCGVGKRWQQVTNVYIRFKILNGFNLIDQHKKTSVPNKFEIHHFEWPHTLFSFQIDGIRAMLKMDRILLADDMGLGKTVQAVATLRILRMREKLNSCLVVAPASVLNQWRQELDKWAPELTAIIVSGSVSDLAWQWNADSVVKLASYDRVRLDIEFLLARQFRRQAFDVVVLDEAQKIKNQNSTSKAMKRIPRKRSWALTGTPIENCESELASIMEFVDYTEGMQQKIYTPGKDLRSRHRELQLRRKKIKVLPDLPPKLETKLLIELDSEQQNRYSEAERDGIFYLKSLGDKLSIDHVLELILRLKQICNFDPVTGKSSKLDDIKNRLWTLTAQGHKALIFSQFSSETFGVAAISDRLKEFNPICLTGKVRPDERPTLIEQFKTKDEHKVMIVSLRVGGLGLNLQEASYVFHFDRWWNPAVEIQADDRTHRMGQTVKVNTIKYTSLNTIEERIEKILTEKLELFRELVDDVSLDLSAKLTHEELLGLFELN